VFRELGTALDALHDMGDPAGASRHVLTTLAPQGNWMIVEPYAGDRIEENLNSCGACVLRRLDADLHALRLVRKSGSHWALRQARRACVQS